MNIEELATIRDEDLAGLADTPAARGLLDAITAGPSRAVVVTRRATFAIAIAAVVAAVVLLAQPHHRAAPQISPVSFKRLRTGWIEAIVRDPFAAQAQLDAAFRREGLHVTVKLFAASPSVVGTVLGGEQDSGQENAILPITGPGCVTGGGGPACPIGVKVRRDFTGTAEIWLGRPARLHETYQSANDSFAPGEALHCSGLVRAPVAQAAPVLKAMRLRVRWDVYGVTNGKITQQANVSNPPAGDLVWDGTPLSEGYVLISVAPGGYPPFEGAATPAAEQLREATRWYSHLKQDCTHP